MENLTAPSTPTIITEQQDRIKALEQKNAELQRLIEWYQEQFRLKKHLQFGASSEKLDGQIELPLFNEAEITGTFPKLEAEEEVSSVEDEKKKARSPRKTLVEELPVEVVTYTLPEEEQACLSCGHHMKEMKKEIRRELKIIPAEVKVIQHERTIYVCRGCEQEGITTPIVSSPMPNPVFPKSMASPSAVAHVMMQKYVAGVPLYRQEQQFEQLGISLSRQTLSNWILYTADQWIEPMVEQIKATLLEQGVLHSDETTLQVLHEKDRKATSSSYMWLFRTGREGPNCVVFEYQTTRASKHPKKFLQDFKGTLHVDGYRGYEDLPNITLSGCWAHARRKFVQAQKAAPKDSKGEPTLTEQAIEKIGAIYKIEKEIASLDSEKRLKIRQEQSVPLVEAYFAWLKEIRHMVVRKSNLGEAITYSLNQQKKLEAPFKDGRLEIDNNRAERTIKPFVIGRKNWLFSNTPKGAKASAAIYSLIETAKENNLQVFHYLVHLFETLPNIDIKDSNELEKLVPWSTQLPEHCYLSKVDTDK